LIMNLLENTNISTIGALVAAANNTDSNSSRVDMAGYDSCLFLAEVAVSANTGVATLTIEGGTTDADPGAGNALTGATATATDGSGGALNNMLLAINVHQPAKRYLQAVRTSAVANITFGPVIAIRYNGKAMPITQLAAEVVASASVSGV
jgi:hypothetical protein